MIDKKLKLLFITNNPEIADFVLREGVDRIFVDLEILGKVERQGHLDTVISRHKMEDISNLRPVLPAGSLLVRLNPVNPETESEINEAIRRGADTLMLPMFHTPEEVKTFCKFVGGRAQVCLLVETIGAMQSLAECIQIEGVNEVHIGLNDLHLEMGCRFMFEPLVSGHVERMAMILKNANMPFGIGGVARVGEGMLPADILLAEHARLGSTGAILSRTFHRQAGSVLEIQKQMDFGQEILKLRTAFQNHCNSTAEALESFRSEIESVVAQIAAKLPEKKRT
jgi:HpcH/HpaI aldolase/citrate lyase family